MIRRLGLLIFTMVGLVSCSDYREVKNEELKETFILNSSPSFEGYFYEGSDNDYSYFISKWDFSSDKFKIPINKLKIKDELKFNKGGKELKIDLINENNDIFAQNEFY